MQAVAEAASAWVVALGIVRDVREETQGYQRLQEAWAAASLHREVGVRRPLGMPAAGRGCILVQPGAAWTVEEGILLKYKHDIGKI